MPLVAILGLAYHYCYASFPGGVAPKQISRHVQSLLSDNKAQLMISHKFLAEHGLHVPDAGQLHCSSATGFHLYMWMGADALGLDGHQVQERVSICGTWT